MKHFSQKLFAVVIFFTVIFLVKFLSDEDDSKELDLSSSILMEEPIEINEEEPRQFSFFMHLNGKPWTNTDTVNVVISSREGYWLFNFQSKYESVLRESLSFTSLLGKDSLPVNTLMTSIDTVYANVYYGYAKFNVDKSSYVPEEHVALSLKPTLRLMLEEVDTVNQLISGTFEGYVEEADGELFVMKSGKFDKVSYSYDGFGQRAL